MTIVMEEDGFNTSLSSLSSLSSQSNYQTLTSNGNPSRNTIFQNQPQSNSPPSSNNVDISGPYAIFLFRSNSSLELFEERKINLDKPCKIGRSVAKIKPEPNNAIFDCKVLSRNHALLWHENSKFFIQDTKSSNGTFLNGNRLGKSNEDSEPYDLTSGDIIQFGVDVTENTKKVTHGCITVEIKLFHKPGVEASIFKPNQVTQSNKIDVQTQELYQLALFLQEAMMREEVLHQKLNSLQGFVDQAKETSDNGWLTLINEDRLLSRIDCLEKQANLFTKNQSEDSLKNSITNLTNEKLNVENTSKLAIQKMIEEKNEVLQKYDELKTVYKLRDDEFTQQQRMFEESKTSLIELAGKYQELLNEFTELQQNHSEAQTKHQESLAQLSSEKQRYETLIDESAHIEKTLNAKIESLIAEKDFTSKRLEGVLNKIEKNNMNIENNVEKTNQTNENKLNGEITSESTEPQEEVIVKSEKNLNGLSETNGFGGHHSKEHLNEEVNVNQSEKSDLKDEKPNEYYQQELELQKIMNDNLLAEIERLRSEMNEIVKEEPSLSLEKSAIEEIKQDSEIKDLVEIIEDAPEYKGTNKIADLKSEYIFIKNKILQIESKTKDVLNNKDLADEKNENLMNFVNSLEQSFRRIYEINDSIDSKESTYESSNAQKDTDQDLNKIHQLQEQLSEMESNYESLKHKLADSETTVDKLNSDFKDISLQVKIVSYISSFPLFILIIAIMVSFYPVLATITATGV